MNLPHVPNALIDYLATTYPTRLPTLSMTDREIWIAVGKGEVIDDLRAIHKAQQEAGDDIEGLPNVLSLPAAATSSDAADSDASGYSSTAARSSSAPGNRLGS